MERWGFLAEKVPLVTSVVSLRSMVTRQKCRTHCLSHVYSGRLAYIYIYIHASKNQIIFEIEQNFLLNHKNFELLSKIYIYAGLYICWSATVLAADSPRFQGQIFETQEN